MHRGSFAFAFIMSMSFGTMGCGGGSGNGDDGPSTDASGLTDAATPPDAFIPPADSYQLIWGPVTVQPGEEDTRCVTVRLGNVPRIHVGQIHNQLSGGSHHLIVYRTIDTAESLTPTHCNPFSDTLDPDKGSPLMITQRHDETLQLPTGVAFTLAPNQMIRLEMHFINTTDAPLEVKSTSTFIPMAEAEFHDEADFLFIGTPDIRLQPNTAATVGPVYFPMPPEFASSKFFAMTGHTHKFGKNVHVATAANTGDTGTPVYDHPDWLWSEPTTTYFDPTFALPNNGGFRFSCDYQNTSNQQVKFGESANDEMCFFWAYYYPSQGSRVCIHTDMLAGGADVCCPGDAYCALIKAYLDML